LSGNIFNNSRDETYTRNENIYSVRNLVSLLKHVTQCRCTFLFIYEISTLRFTDEERLNYSVDKFRTYHGDKEFWILYSDGSPG